MKNRQNSTSKTLFSKKVKLDFSTFWKVALILLVVYDIFLSSRLSRPEAPKVEHPPPSPPPPVNIDVVSRKLLKEGPKLAKFPAGTDEKLTTLPDILDLVPEFIPKLQKMTTPYNEFFVVSHSPEWVVSNVGMEMTIYHLWKYIIERSSADSIVIDTGANHAVYSTFAALLGRRSIAIEPQVDLVMKDIMAARINGVMDKIQFLNIAVLDVAGVKVNMIETGNDGGTGTIVPGDTGSVTTFRLDDIIPPELHCCLMKIDVEGFEVPALKSAKALFERKQVDHVIVEFGPVSRWTGSSKTTAEEAAAAIQDMQRFGFHVRIIRSLCWEYMAKHLPVSTFPSAKIEYMDVPEVSIFMGHFKESQYECYLWFGPAQLLL